MLDWVTKAGSLGGNTVAEMTETECASPQNNPYPFVCKWKLSWYFAQKKYLLHNQHHLLQIRSRIPADAQSVCLAHQSAFHTP